jgi:prepilin-type N-terminal cleavage/methylation domain-containing protein
MQGLFKKACKDEKGFTLIELLVVVVILGVIAAIALLAVYVFFGSGTLEAANAELHQAQTAVAASLSEAGVAELDAAVTGWDGSAAINCPTSTASDGTTYPASDYLHKVFKGLYDVDINGTITNAANGTWAGSITWDDANGRWIET